MNEKEATRYTIYKAIVENVVLSKNLDDLKSKLQKEGIETLYKYIGQTSEVQGISFRIGEYKYKGSEIDRKFSVKNLERIIKQQQALTALKVFTKGSVEKKNNATENSSYRYTGSLLGELMKPERGIEQTPYELTMKEKPEKKKSRGLHL